MARAIIGTHLICQVSMPIPATPDVRKLILELKVVMSLLAGGEVPLLLSHGISHRQ